MQMTFHSDDDYDDNYDDNMIAPLEEILTMSSLDSKITDLSQDQARAAGLRFSEYKEQNLTKIIH